MQVPWVLLLESQGSDSATLPVRATPTLLGGDRMACNYTARAFRALTYPSPGKERDEKTSAYLLVLTSKCRNLSFFIYFPWLCFSCSFLPPSTCLERIVLEVLGPFWASFDDFQEREKKNVEASKCLWFRFEKWLLMREDNHCKSWGFCHRFKCCLNGFISSFVQ